MKQQFKTEGSKYRETKDMAVKEISKLIRKEIKIRFPEIKTSVRTDGATGIDIEIKELPFRVTNPEFVNFGIDHPHERYPSALDVPRYTPKAIELRDAVREIASAYNFDDSDSMTDYFHRRFYLSVDFTYKIEEEERDYITELRSRSVRVLEWKQPSES